MRLPGSTGEPAKRLLQYRDPAAGRWATAGGAYRFSVGSSIDTELEDTVILRP